MRRATPAMPEATRALNRRAALIIEAVRCEAGLKLRNPRGHSDAQYVLCSRQAVAALIESRRGDK